MKYTIDYDPAEEIITVSFAGEANLGAVSTMMDQLAETILKTQCNRVLVDVLNLDHSLSLIELITISGMMQSTARVQGIDLKSLRRAMVSQNNGKMMEVYEIMARYASENFKRFHTLEEARTWLKEG